MATSTQQKQELFKSIWAIANELRGSVDGWDFKQYVLGMLFYRYISENSTELQTNAVLYRGRTIPSAYHGGIRAAILTGHC